MAAMTARELMASIVCAVSPDATLSGAAKLLSSHHLGGVPVVAHDGTIVGIVAEADILAKSC